MKDRGIPPKCACGCGGDVTWGLQNENWNTYICGHNSLWFKNKLQVNKNPPTCACGCGGDVSLRHGHWNKYIKGHNGTKQNLKLMRLETPPKCGCGCGGDVTWNIKTNCWNKFLKGHKTAGLTTRPSINECPPKCACGCGGDVTWNKKKKSWNKYIHHHDKKGSKWSEETKAKNRLIPQVWTDERREKVRLLHTGRKLSDEDRQKRRINKIKYIENQKNNGYPLSPTVGKYEMICLNILQSIIGYNIIKQSTIFKYINGAFPDGYIPQFKLVIEFDEKNRRHFKDPTTCKIYVDKDISRELSLAAQGLIIFRITQKDWEDNQQLCIDRFKLLIEELELQYKS